ncbi:MAG TPA: hypothetical protein VHO25_01295 [Polyangiaceae bacterium]|nr:hypothetical protein [Polyangiaceae bacterium]
MRIAYFLYHAWFAVAWVGTSCTPSEQAPARQPTAPAHDQQLPLWPHFEQAQAWPKLEYPITSGGHSGQPYTAIVRVSPSALQQYQSLVAGSVLPGGTTVVQSHRDKTGRGGPIYVMEKLSTGWTFSELDEKGRFLRQGNLVDCARCHAEAVADSLFGPDRSTPKENDPPKH